MMEIVYKEGKQQEKDNVVESLPKNIRQIGEPDDRLPVYMEDFAATYLQKTEKYRPEQIKFCILYGECKEYKGRSVMFIKSAARLLVQDIPKEQGLAEPEWKAAEGIREKFFPEQKILGWALLVNGANEILLEQIKTMHRHHFTEKYQVLLWIDGGEKERLMFNAGAGELLLLNGYNIYYEENRWMQEYMIAHNPSDSDRVGEPEDQAVKEFRQVISRKGANYDHGAGKMIRVVAAACTVFAIAGVLKYVQNTKDQGIYPTAASMVRQQWEQEATAIEPQKETSEIQRNLTDAESNQETATVSTTVLQEDVKESEATAVTAATDEQAADAEQDGQSAEKENTQAVTTGYRAYQVQAGDTISSISQNYYGSMRMVEEICTLNQIAEQDLIYTGQILLLP